MLEEQDRITVEVDSQDSDEECEPSTAAMKSSLSRFEAMTEAFRYYLALTLSDDSELDMENISCSPI